LEAVFERPDGLLWRFGCITISPQHDGSVRGRWARRRLSGTSGIWRWRWLRCLIGTISGICFGSLPLRPTNAQKASMMPKRGDRLTTIDRIRGDLAKMRKIAADGDMGLVSYYLDLADAELTDIEHGNGTDLTSRRQTAE